MPLLPLQVVEFVDFKERLAASHTWALGRAEEAALRLRTAASGAGAGAGGAAATQLLLAALEGVGLVQEGPRGSQGSDSVESDAQGQVPGLRFNEDLSTRPAWLPPAAAPCRLAVAEWWEEWSRGGCTGAGLRRLLLCIYPGHSCVCT